jgi:hypothetical protein
MNMKKRPAIDRFNDFIGHKKDIKDCWIWQGCTDTKGYGLLRIKNKNVKAHRFSYQYYIGPIPKGLQLDHLCKVKNCVNPNHLEAVTLQENMRRSQPDRIFSFDIGKANREKTHCPSGHKYSVENTYIRNKSRNCKKCNTKSERRKKAQLRKK